MLHDRRTVRSVRAGQYPGCSTICTYRASTILFCRTERAIRSSSAGRTQAVTSDLDRKERRKALKSGCTLAEAARTWIGESAQAFAARQAAPYWQTAAPEEFERKAKSRVTLHQFETQREIPGTPGFPAMTLQAISRMFNRVPGARGFQWQRARSCVTDKKTNCVYIAASEKLRLEGARRGHIPAQRVWQMRIEPAQQRDSTLPGHFSRRQSPVCRKA
jgi:hypothetical protein